MNKLQKDNIDENMVGNYACEFAMWLTGNFWIPSLEYPQIDKFIKYKNTKTGEMKPIKDLEHKFRTIYGDNK